MQGLGTIRHDRPVEIVAIPGDSQTEARLAALGLLPGVRVQVVRQAPLRDPICVLVDGRETSIRRHDANLIQVIDIP